MVIVSLLSNKTQTKTVLLILLKSSLKAMEQKELSHSNGIEDNRVTPAILALGRLVMQEDCAASSRPAWITQLSSRPV